MSSEQPENLISADSLVGSSQRTAESLASRHQLRANDCILVALENSREHLELLFAAWRLRLQWVCIAPTASREVLQGIARAIKPRALALDKSNTRLLDAVNELRPASIAESSVTSLGTLSVLSGIEEEARVAATPGSPRTDRAESSWTDWLPRQPPGIFYTSGSTASAKGVVLRWETILEKGRQVLSYYGASSRDCVVPILPISHVYGLYPLLGALSLGTRAAWVQERASPAKIARTLQTSHATIVICPPFVARFLLSPGRMDADTLSRLRVVSIGGAAASPATVNALISALPRTSVFLSYGLAETYSTTCCVNVSSEGDKVESVGPFRFMARAEVRDPTRGVRLGPGEIGELCIAGSITEGYFRMDKEAQTAFFTADGWLRTGDLAQMDEAGYVFIRGRLKELINAGGLSIHPSEIEEALAAHPAVLDAGVFGIEEGEHETICAAVVVRTKENDVSEVVEGLYEFCWQRLSAKMVPRKIVVVDSIPRGALGKIARAELRRMVEGSQKEN